MAAPRRLTTTDDDNKPVLTDTDQKYDAFMRWFVMPIEDKEANGLPTSIAEFLQKHDLKLEELNEFRSNPRFHDDVEKYVAQWTYSKYPALAHRLYAKAAKTLDPALLREFRSFGRDHVEKRKAEKDGGGVNINFNLNVPEEQYRQIVAREAKVLSGSSEEASS